jgi:hypothetical protein
VADAAACVIRQDLRKRKSRSDERDREGEAKEGALEMQIEGNFSKFAGEVVLVTRPRPREWSTALLL